MVGIPKKALRVSDLKYEKAITGSSHPVDKVTFIEDGVSKTAFYKKISSEHKYPEFLALMCVAVSVFFRSFQGSHAAEERLVFNEQDQIVGTLSIALEGFRPFNFSSEPVPEDPREKELAIPSTQTLIEKNFMAVMVSWLLLNNNDPHGHNAGISGDHSVHLDYDMCLITIAKTIKGARSVLITNQTRVSHTVNDWDNFPDCEDLTAYHWPTLTHPGETVLPTLVPGQKELISSIALLPKQYANPTAFKNLAGSPVAQEQKLAAALKILVTYQPNVLRARLLDYIGDRPLNYTALSANQINEYERTFPALFNTQTNTKPFIDFMLAVYQEHYDSFYRLVVFYTGIARNRAGLSQPSTSSALYLKPSLYQTIVDWVKEQNRQEEPSTQLNLEVLEKRYHQVWRDAYVPSFKNLLQMTVSLIKSLLIKLSAASNNTSALPLSIASKDTTDYTVTKAWELFGRMPELTDEKIKSFINVDPDSKLREGLKELFAFANQFYAIIQTYYDKESVDLELMDSQNFFSAMTLLHTNHDLSIREKLGVSTVEAIEFGCISDSLNLIVTQAYFKRHLLSRDEGMRNSATGAGITEKVLPLTNKEIQAQFIRSLFDWALTSDLTRLINTIIDRNNTSWRALQRADTVKTYLRSSSAERGDNRLAYIFSSGGSGDRLNQLLIEHLTPEVLKIHQIPSINAATPKMLREHINSFVSSAEQYAKSDSRFTHLLSDASRVLLCHTWFERVGALTAKEFQKINSEVLTDYRSKLSVLRLSLFKATESREREFNEDVSALKVPQKVYASTFRKGDTYSALNKSLFDQIIGLIQTEMRTNPRAFDTPGYKLIAQYDPDQHSKVYLEEIKSISVRYTHDQALSSTAPLAYPG